MAIYGIRPRPCNPIEYFSSEETLVPGILAVIATPHGDTITPVVSGPLMGLPGSRIEDLPVILRKATEEDEKIYKSNQSLALKARDFCRERIKIRKLEMKLVDVEIFSDKSKLVFYFTSPTRIDFRELVKDLVAEYRCRIELRQIGVRHETQMLGATGNCGQVCCCKRHLRQFAPVTIRMAKDQNLFLNPAKISGICGRLLCCLSYEQETYENFYNEAPKTGRKYLTTQGLLKVNSTNMFKNNVSVINEKNEEFVYSLDEWKNLKPERLSAEQSQSSTEA